MAKRIIDGIEVETGSGNVFADLGLPDADKLKIKSGLVIEISRAVRKLGLTQHEAARRMGITQPKVSDMPRGDFTNPAFIRGIGRNLLNMTIAAGLLYRVRRSMTHGCFLAYTRRNTDSPV
ncbi:MAG: XRE family transcriptional regulator [Betaproteobacteria bacterium]|nr:XRE family transcriptional regulator [Betaproteobacteria bacterium]